MKKILLQFILLTALVYSYKLNYGQAPSLGTAANFAIFTGSGAITNVGISQVTGNVGSNVGAATNFGNVNGVMHSQNIATAACAADLLTATSQLASATNTFFPSSLLGNGDTLIAGVYSIAAAATLTSTLYLNAQGNPNAVFIFKVSGTFATGANAKVRLINGAQACKVFWKIDGAVTMASGTYMRGTVIANNAAISMSAGDTLEGRALSTVGGIAVNGVMIYTPIGCGSPYLTGPSAPNLASTTLYTFLSGIGPVTNTGTSTVVGDVGTNLGLTTGFNPLLVTGTIHPIPDASTSAAASDLTNVINYLSLLPYDIELLYPAQFGKNLVLTPHTYLLNAATSFTDTLFLNAQGNANAVFVIKIYGALSTSTYANVVLINGTQSRNVYWLVNGAVSVASNSIFRGNILTNNGAISFATGCTLDGRAFTNIGAINLSNINAFSSNVPAIVNEPISQLVCLGAAVKFGVKATGSGLTYKWRKGNVDLVNGPNLTGVSTDTLRFAAAAYTDTASNYNVIVYSSFLPNDTSNNVQLKIKVGANITSITSAVTICPVGDSIEMNVIATGDSSLSYQWRKGNINLINDLRIFGVQTSKLQFKPAIAADAANNYNVVVSGVCSSKDTSSNVILSVNSATSITLEPPNKLVCSGNSTQFVVAATGVNLNYQWRKGNVNLTNTANISGVTNDTLFINAVTGSDVASNYNVIVSGTCGANDTSNNASLQINGSTIITLEPSNKLVCSGDAVLFVVAATGVNLNYQWRKGNVNLINTANISGVNNDTLFINSATGSDVASNYNVIVSGTCGANDTSNNASLQINGATVITLEPTNKLVCSGDAVQFAVAATGVNLNYQWRKGNVNLINTGNITGVNNDTLRFNSVLGSDQATNYNVIVSGTCGANDTSNNASLQINGATVITLEPTNKLVCSGDAVQFVVAATGVNLNYQWRKGNVNLTNTANISGVNNDTLFINAATGSDVASNYNVIVSGTCGANDTSNNASLQINGSTIITLEPTNKLVCSGDAVQFVIAATGVNLNYQWRKGNVNLSNTANISGVTNDTLFINAATGSDVASNYNVIVSGTCGGNDTSNNASLQINGSTIITLEPTNKLVCSGDAVQFVVAATGVNLNYQWRKGNINLINTANISGVNNDTLRFISVLGSDQANNYNVIVSGSCGANDTSSNATLTVNAIPTATASSNSPVCVGDPINLFSQLLSNGTYNWSGPNAFSSASQNPSITSASFADSGFYNLVITQNGCNSVPVSIKVVVKECIIQSLNIPEGFSPNGDGVNDLYVIRGLEIYTNNSFQVFNRWGNEVFASAPYSNNWAGTSNSKISLGGEALPIGVYFYVLSLGDGSAILKGTIYLNK